MPPPPVHTLPLETLRRQAALDVWVHRIRDHPANAPHDHVFHEIVYVESGSAVHETAAGRQTVRPGDLLVFRPYTWHAYREPHRFSIINCLFSGALVHRFQDLLQSVPGSFDLFRRQARDPATQHPIVLHCRPAEQAALLAQLETIMAEHEAAESGWQLAVTGGLLEVLRVTARLWAETWHPEPVQLADRTERAIQETVRHLEAHYTEPMDLDALARRVHLSRWHLSRNFNRRMGMSVSAFVHRLRAEAACRHLRLTDQPIGQIARELGYHEVAYFTRCFRKHMGRSPRAYRRGAT